MKTVIACCALHNWILENGDDEYVYDDDSWYRVLPRSNRVYRDIREENAAWVLKRDQIAQALWQDKVGQSMSATNQDIENENIDASM